MSYRIEPVYVPYTYTSYMECTGNGSWKDLIDCKAEFVVYRGNCKLKAHSSLENAEAHVKRLETNRKVKERSNE